MMICSPVRLRMRVLFNPTLSTVPRVSPTTIKSPTSNGLSSAIDSEANTSPRIRWTAMATARPVIPRLVTIVLTRKLGILSRITRITNVQRTTRAKKPNRFRVELSRWSS